ncbi:hypothetical protein ABN034_11645 [Actinopolymorpha sp. B11F2]|uniref:CBM96 family carbohydrate-binding protein n=1 Tax=Actinopolymorpha sp. B11F2 TaxID=3160862 RepID=UPI0032E466CC
MSPIPPPPEPARGLSRRTLLGGLAATGAAAGTLAGSPMPSAAAATSNPGPAAGGAELRIVVENAPAGRGMPLVGYNTGHYLPGSNTSAWLAYSRVNAVRFFASLVHWTPDEAFDPGEGIDDIDDFDLRKAELRRDPERNPFLRWDILEDVFENQVYPTTNFYRLNYQVGELKRLGIVTIMEAAELGWNSPLSGLWLQWQKHYAFTYHLARHYDVERYNFVNEPDHPSAAHDIVDQDIYVRGLQIASDAIRSAVADVNQRYGKRLRACVQAPVITHVSSSRGDDHMDADPDADPRDDEYGWGQISLMNLRTDYHGDTIVEDVFHVFDTHQYNKTADTYAYEISMMREKMRAYTPTGVALPIVYSEFNRRNTSAFETSGDDLDTPLIYCDLAQIWSTALAGQVEGMIAFKFQNTMRANGIPYGTGFYYLEHEGLHDIHGVSKAGEMQRLFAKGFKGDRSLMKASADDGRTVVVSQDRAASCHYLWLPHPSGTPGGEVDLDLRALPIPRHGTRVIVEEVSPAHSGGIVADVPLPETKQITLHQPADSVWLLTIAGPGRVRTHDAAADATVRRSGDSGDGEEALAVALDTTGAGPTEVSYLLFEVGPEARHARRAHLELCGASEDGQPFTFMVYAVTDTSWAGQDFDWDSAPYLDGEAVHPTDVGRTVYPAGQVSTLGVVTPARLDVTDALRQVSGDTIAFLLIREQRRAEDVADNGRRAVFASRHASDPARRPRLTLTN